MVIVVHHCGISGDRPRGHTSLTGAVEFQTLSWNSTAPVSEVWPRGRSPLIPQ